MNHAAKECAILFGLNELTDIESDMIVFVPKKTDLTIRNNSKTATAVMRVELSMFS